MLGREPDEGGLKNWLTHLENGMSPEFLVAGFVGSAEFKGICANYGIAAGSIVRTQARDQNPKVTAFVQRCYVQALSRKGDAGGLNSWTNHLLSRKLTPKQVAYNFVFSAECVNKNLSNIEFVKLLYRLYMGREFDQGGLDGWLRNLSKGMTRQQVANHFADSAEFRGIVASYGL